MNTWNVDAARPHVSSDSSFKPIASSAFMRSTSTSPDRRSSWSCSHCGFFAQYWRTFFSAPIAAPKHLPRIVASFSARPWSDATSTSMKFASAAIAIFAFFGSERKASRASRASTSEPCFHAHLARPRRAFATVVAEFVPARRIAFSNACAARSQLLASISASPALTNWPAE